MWGRGFGRTASPGFEFLRRFSRAASTRSSSRYMAVRITNCFLVFFGCFPTQKRFPFNEWFSRIECSADLPSCKCPLVSGSIALHVFASPSAQQRWQRAHVLVLGGNGSHAGGAPAAHAVLSGRAERFGPSALVENDRSVQRAGGEPATEAVSL